MSGLHWIYSQNKWLVSLTKRCNFLTEEKSISPNKFHCSFLIYLIYPYVWFVTNKKTGISRFPLSVTVCIRGGVLFAARFSCPPAPLFPQFPDFFNVKSRFCLKNKVFHRIYSSWMISDDYLYRLNCVRWIENVTINQAAVIIDTNIFYMPYFGV